MELAIIVERRGRKRKSGARHPGGQLVRAKIDDPKVVALKMPHRLDVPRQFAHDPKAESVLGRYNLNGVITDLEWDAGIYYRGVVGRYLAIINAPKANMQSCTGEPKSKGQPFEFSADEAQRRKSAYDEAYEAVEEGGGQRGAMALKRVAVYDQLCPDGMIGPMRYSLVGLMLVRGMCTKTLALDMRNKIRLHYRNIC